MPIVSGGGASGVISGVTVTGTAASGDVPVASSSSAGTWAFPPGHEFDYAEFTSDIAITASTEGTAQTIVAGNSVTYDGSTVVLITFFCPVIQGTTAGIVRVILLDGSTSLGWLTNEYQGVEGNNNFLFGMVSRRLTPSAAAHTYTIAAFNSAAAKQTDFQAGAGGSGTLLPGYIRITKV